MAKFDLTEKEKELAKAFMDKHKQCRPKYNMPFSYIFEPNGIGIAVTIKCPYCGEEKDITDIDSW